MSKLVAYLKSWGESLFNTKKQWAANCASPSRNFVKYDNLSGEGSFIAPADGFARIYSSGQQWVSLSGSESNTWATRFLCDQGERENGYLETAGTIPVRKGEKVLYLFAVGANEGVKNEVIFIQSNGY